MHRISSRLVITFALVYTSCLVLQAGASTAPIPVSASAEPSASSAEPAASVNNLGSVALKEGRFSEAERRFRESLAMLERANLVNTPTGLVVLSNLGLALQKQRQYDSARDIYSRAFEVSQRVQGADSIQHAKLLVDSGLLSFVTGNYPEAIRKDKFALQIESKIPDLSSFDRATAENNLGMALLKLGHLAEAEEHLKTAIDSYRSDLRNIDPAVIETMNAFAMAEQKMGKLDEADGTVNEALAIAERVLPPQDVSFANLHNTLGILAMERSKNRVAKAQYQAALKIWGKSAGPNSCEYAATLSNLATLEDRSGHHGRAAELYLKALRTDEAILGPNHPRIASDLDNLAAQLFARRQWVAALSLYKRAKDIQQRSFGPASADIANTWRSIAVVYQRSNRLDEAKLAYENAITAFEASVPEAPEYGLCLRDYASLLRLQKRFVDAELTDVLAGKIEVKNAIRADTPGVTIPITKSFR